MNETRLNKRQKRTLAAMRSANGELYQKRSSDCGAQWHVWHPVHASVRICLTCRDVMGLVRSGLVTRADPNTGKRMLVRPAVP